MINRNRANIELPGWWGRIFVLTALFSIPIGCSRAATPSATPEPQLSIDRVDFMPPRPAGYKLKDWKAVARGFDKLVYDDTARGEHLPIIFWDDTRVNISERGFALPSYVGRADGAKPRDSDALCTIASVVSASLVGIDKSAGPNNWVRMLLQYYRSADGQNVVLNNIDSVSGETYWYELYPQLQFNFVAKMYPGETGVQAAFRTSSEQWYKAYKALAAEPGGLNFDHTAFNLKTMRPVNNGKWTEPDAAGALAAIMLQAYVAMGDAKFRDAAIDLIGYLDRRETSPYYEVLMTYGAVTGARLNAEEGTNFDVRQLLNWCMNPSDTRPAWGVAVGNWSGYEVSGLSGASDAHGGYAFLMNTFGMTGTLAPVARYDERFAAALGKFILHVASNARYFYPDEVPAKNQSFPNWKSDPANVIAYEGIRRRYNGQEPYASGDPVIYKWGPKTDLGIYGSAHVGWLAGIVEATDQPMILRIDLLKTDFYHRQAHPTFLYYNPHDNVRAVTVTTGGTAETDIYDAVANDFVARKVKGETKIEFAPRQARVLVMVPGGTPTRLDGRKLLAGDVVIDFNNGTVPRPSPRIRPAVVSKARVFEVPRGAIIVDGNAADWSRVTGSSITLDTAGRGQMKCDLRFAWDETFLYVHAKQNGVTPNVHEAANAEQLEAAPWDFDVVRISVDMGNGERSVIGDVPIAFGFSSTGRDDLSIAIAHPGERSLAIKSATSGKSEDGTRFIEARIAWNGLRRCAFGAAADAGMKDFRAAAGLTIGCEPLLVEFNHTKQSFIGGAQYKAPNGNDANSIDLRLIEK